MKTRLAIGRTGQYKNFIDCAQKIHARDGLRGFYRGIVPGLIGVVPYAGIDLCVYEVSKQLYFFNQFLTGISILYPLGNTRILWVFRGYKIGTLTANGLK